MLNSCGTNSSEDGRRECQQREMDEVLYKKKIFLVLTKGVTKYQYIFVFFFSSNERVIKRIKKKCPPFSFNSCSGLALFIKSDFSMRCIQLY